MPTQITTGQNIFRTQTKLSAADILALDTVPVNLAPAQAGKSLVPIGIGVAGIYAFGTTEYTISTGVAQLRYGNAAGGSHPLGTTEVLTALINGKTQSQIETVAPASLATVNLSTVQGLGVFLVATTAGFAATGGDGSVTYDVWYQAL